MDCCVAFGSSPRREMIVTSRPFTPSLFAAYPAERINSGDQTHRVPQVKRVISGPTPEVAQGVDELYKEIIAAGTHMAALYEWPRLPRSLKTLSAI